MVGTVDTPDRQDHEGLRFQAVPESPGYLIQIAKQTSTLGGEVTTVNFNVRKGATEEEIQQEMDKVYSAIDARVTACNEKFKKRQEELGKKKILDLEDLQVEEASNEGSAEVA